MNPISTKNTKISRGWLLVPVVPPTQEAETGELLESGRQREAAVSRDYAIALQPGQQTRLPLKKKKKYIFKVHNEMFCYIHILLNDYHNQTNRYITSPIYQLYVG